jgi:hypothetical protein
VTVTQARWLAVPSSQADPTWRWQVALFLSGVNGLASTWSRHPATLLARPLTITRTGPLWLAPSLPEALLLALSAMAGPWLIAARRAGPRAGRGADADASPRRGLSLDLPDEL